MAEADLSKIVNLIMENPNLVEQIKGLAEKSKDENPTEAQTEDIEAQENEVTASTYEIQNDSNKIKRKDLLCALKPYVSEERGKAIDSMISIADILDMLKTR